MSAPAIHTAIKTTGLVTVIADFTGATCSAVTPTSASGSDAADRDALDATLGAALLVDRCAVDTTALAAGSTRHWNGASLVSPGSAIAPSIAKVHSMWRSAADRVRTANAAMPTSAKSAEVRMSVSIMSTSLLARALNGLGEALDG